MEQLDAGTPEPRPGRWEQIKQPRTLALAAAAVVVGLLGAALGQKLWLKPQMEIARKRVATFNDVTELFKLQLLYQKQYGEYANDLDSLLSVAPNRAEMKAAMAEHLDLATLAVVGNDKKFKIEANVLDDERTLIQIRGPVRDKPRRQAPNLPSPAALPNEDGKPILRTR